MILLVKKKMIDFDYIENKIDYKFKNRDLLVRAFTHSSFSNLNNERLEFLGDSVLQIIVSKYLFNKFSNNEGQLTKYRAKIVCEDNLWNTISKLGLEQYLIVGESYKGKPSKAMSADLCEAILGAIYIDSDSLEKPKDFIEQFISFDVLENVDYKTTLQELVQGDGCTTKDIEYSTAEIDNGQYEKKFQSSVYVCGKLLGSGIGKTKKDAEKESAKIAIEKYKSGEKYDI